MLHKRPVSDLEHSRFSAVHYFGSHGKVSISTERHMHGLIYLIGLIVVVMAILSFFGLR